MCVCLCGHTHMCVCRYVHMEATGKRPQALFLRDYSPCFLLLLIILLFIIINIILLLQNLIPAPPVPLLSPHYRFHLPTACILSWNSSLSTSCCHCVLRAIHWGVGSPTRAIFRKTDLLSSSSQLSSFILQAGSDIAHEALISSCIRGWTWTSYSSDSTSNVLGLQICTATSNSHLFLILIWQ